MSRRPSDKSINPLEYHSWCSMMTRCYNTKRPDYKHYGGRGVKVCEDWRISFLSFLDHVGPKPTPKHCLDRIDVDGHYEPGNVRWVTRAESTFNRRNSVRVLFRGKIMHPRDVSSICGIPYDTLRNRAGRGLTPSEIFRKPPSSHSVGCPFRYKRGDCVCPTGRVHLEGEDT